MNQQIIEYLQQNKNQYSKEDLIEQLKKAGHAAEDIELAVSNVYEVDGFGDNEIEEVPPLPELPVINENNSNNKIVYRNQSVQHSVEKNIERNKRRKEIWIGIGAGLGIVMTWPIVMSTLSGLFLSLLAGISSSDYMDIFFIVLINAIGFGVPIIILIWLFKKGKKYIAIGILISIFVIPILLFGACMMLLAGSGLF